MSWPSEAGALAGEQARRRGSAETAGIQRGIVDVPPWRPPFVEANAPRRRRALRPRSRATAVDASTFRAKVYGELRGLYRVFNAAEYRFYRSDSAPPEEDDSPFATNATLPCTPADTFADGTWWLSMSHFNGVLDSGFLPLGPAGETYVRKEIATGGAGPVYTPPNGPLSWRLVALAGGVVQIQGNYFQRGVLRADTWAIAYTVDETTPPANAPDITVAMPATAGGVAVLDYNLPAQAHGTTVKVRVQTRRLDGSTLTYSQNSVVQTIIADAVGPAAPMGLAVWSGRLPEET